MKNFSRLIFLMVVLLVGAGGVFLATWDIPAPTQTIEKELPDDRFPR